HRARPYGVVLVAEGGGDIVRGARGEVAHVDVDRPAFAVLREVDEAAGVLSAGRVRPRELRAAEEPRIAGGLLWIAGPARPVMRRDGDGERKAQEADEGSRTCHVRHEFLLLFRKFGRQPRVARVYASCGPRSRTKSPAAGSSFAALREAEGTGQQSTLYSAPHGAVELRAEQAPEYRRGEVDGDRCAGSAGAWEGDVAPACEP